MRFKGLFRGNKRVKAAINAIFENDMKNVRQINGQFPAVKIVSQ